MEDYTQALLRMWKGGLPNIQGIIKKGAKCLRGKAPLTLVMKRKIGSKSMALKMEAKVKKLSKIKKEMFVDGKIKIKELWR